MIMKMLTMVMMVMSLWRDSCRHLWDYSEAGRNRKKNYPIRPGFALRWLWWVFLNRLTYELVSVFENIQLWISVSEWWGQEVDVKGRKVARTTVFWAPVNWSIKTNVLPSQRVGGGSKLYTTPQAHMCWYYCGGFDSNLGANSSWLCGPAFCCWWYPHVFHVFPPEKLFTLFARRSKRLLSKLS